MADIQAEYGVEPPLQRRSPGPGPLWPGRLAPLVETPGVWGRFGPFGTPVRTASQLRTGTLKRPPGKWEFTGRTIDGVGWVYAMYVGPE